MLTTFTTMSLIDHYTNVRHELEAIEYSSDTSINELKQLIADLIRYTKTTVNDEFVLMHLGLNMDILTDLDQRAGAIRKREAFEECKKELHSDINTAITTYKIKLHSK